MNNNYISAAELGRIIGVSSPTIKKYLREGKIQADMVSITGRSYFLKSRVEEIVRQLDIKREYFSVKDITEKYGVSASYVYNRRSKLQAERNGKGQLQFDPEVVKRYFVPADSLN